MENIPLYQKGCGDASCGVSTSIMDCLTFGKGELDDNGFWEFPCEACSQAYYQRKKQDFQMWIENEQH